MIKFNVVNLVNNTAKLFLFVYLFGLSAQYSNNIISRIFQLSLYLFIGVAVLCTIIKKHILINNYIIIYMMFFVFSIVSCFYAPDFTVSFNSLYILIIPLIFCICITQVITDIKTLKYCALAYIAGTIVLMIYLISTNQLNADVRLGNALTGNANTFAYIYMISACFSAYAVVFTSGYKKIISISIYLLTLYALVLSGGRKFIVVAIFSLCLLLFNKTDKRGRKQYFKYLLFIGAAVIFVWWAIFNVPFIYDNVGYRFESLLSDQRELGTPAELDASSEIRFAMIRYGLTEWLEHPILGHGNDSFKYISTFGVYSHNNYVELLFNTGIVGFLIYYTIIIDIIRKLFKNKYDNLKWFFFAMVLSFLVYDYGAVSYNKVFTQIIYASAYVYFNISSDNIV